MWFVLCSLATCSRKFNHWASSATSATNVVMRVAGGASCSARAWSLECLFGETSQVATWHPSAAELAAPVHDPSRNRHR